MAETEASLDLLIALFECPVFVHNSAFVRRHDRTARERLKNFLTRRVRQQARRQGNDRLTEAVHQRNAATFEHLRGLAEEALLARHAEDELGRLFYSASLQHPAVMGKHLAALYRDLLACHVHLGKKKLVVTDLDNTLWEGEIGEGRVRHYSERQRVLKRLKEK